MHRWPSGPGRSCGPRKGREPMGGPMRRQEESALRTDLRAAVDRICADFPGEYWREFDRERAYPEKFVEALTATGCLGALIPEEYGGLGLSLGDASVILEQINANGATAAPVHAQLY